MSSPAEIPPGQTSPPAPPDTNPPPRTDPPTPTGTPATVPAAPVPAPPRTVTPTAPDTAILDAIAALPERLTDVIREAVAKPPTPNTQIEQPRRRRTFGQVWFS